MLYLFDIKRNDTAKDEKTKHSHTFKITRGYLFKYNDN